MTNPTSLEQAAAVATAIAATLNQQTTPLTAANAVNVMGAVLAASAPLISPQAAATLALVNLALSAVHVATNTTHEVTADQLAALFAAGEAAFAADKAAQAAVTA